MARLCGDATGDRSDLPIVWQSACDGVTAGCGPCLADGWCCARQHSVGGLAKTSRQSAGPPRLSHLYQPLSGVLSMREAVRPDLSPPSTVYAGGDTALSEPFLRPAARAERG